MNTGDLNKALKDLVNVITDQEIVQSDLNDDDGGEIQWTWEIGSVKICWPTRQCEMPKVFLLDIRQDV